MVSTILVTGGAGYIGSHACVAQCWANVSLVQCMLGWRATRSLLDMREDSWRWHSENPEAYR